MFSIIHNKQNGSEIITGNDLLDCLTFLGVPEEVNQEGEPPVTDPLELVEQYNSLHQSEGKSIVLPLAIRASDKFHQKVKKADRVVVRASIDDVSEEQMQRIVICWEAAKHLVGQ